MTEPDDTEDIPWFDALAGRPDPAASPHTNREALAVRRALEAHATLMDEKIPEAGPELYERIRFRLRKEALSRPSQERDFRADARAAIGLISPKTILGDRIRARWQDRALRRPSRIGRTPVAWAAAAAIVLSVGLLLTLQRPLFDHAELAAPGGDAFATIVVASDPRTRLSEILRDLEPVTAVVGAIARNAPSKPVVEELGDNRIKVTIEATQDALDYFGSQDIDPTIKDGKIVLIITPP